MTPVKAEREQSDRFQLPSRSFTMKSVASLPFRNLLIQAESSLAMIYLPQSEEEYEHLVALLDSLIDEVGEDESHPLASLMEIVGVLIEKYENEQVPEITA